MGTIITCIGQNNKQFQRLNTLSKNPKLVLGRARIQTLIQDFSASDNVSSTIPQLGSCPVCCRCLAVLFNNPLNALIYTTKNVSQSLSHVLFSATPRPAARQASLSFTNSQALLRLSPSSRRCHPTTSPCHTAKRPLERKWCLVENYCVISKLTPQPKHLKTSFFPHLTLVLNSSLLRLHH